MTALGQASAGGDFVVTVTHTVQLRVPDVAVVAEALGMSAEEALGEIADVLGVAGLHLDELDALPLDSFSIVRTDRVDIHVEPIGRQPTAFVVVDGPLTSAAADALIAALTPTTEGAPA